MHTLLSPHHTLLPVWVAALNKWLLSVMLATLLEVVHVQISRFGSATMLTTFKAPVLCCAALCFAVLCCAASCPVHAPFAAFVCLCTVLHVLVFTGAVKTNTCMSLHK